MKARQKMENSTRASAGRKVGKTRILVVDDHPIVCQALADLINRQSDLHCCGTAGTLAEVQQGIARHKPGLVLLDLRLGAADGLESIKTLKSQFPDLRLLVISQFDENAYAELALRAGALGYVMKEQATEEVLRAIRTLLTGDIYVSPKMRLQAVRRMLDTKRQGVQGVELSALTDRELCVFKAIGAGKTNKQIAADLNLSVKTIETYREHIKYKLKLSSGAELVSRARSAVQAESARALT